MHRMVCAGRRGGSMYLPISTKFVWVMRVLDRVMPLALKPWISTLATHPSASGWDSPLGEWPVCSNFQEPLQVQLLQMTTIGNYWHTRCTQTATERISARFATGMQETSNLSHLCGRPLPWEQHGLVSPSCERPCGVWWRCGYGRKNYWRCHHRCGDAQRQSRNTESAEIAVMRSWDSLKYSSAVINALSDALGTA